MKKLAHFIVTHRNKIFVVFVLLAVLGLFGMINTNVNQDMSKYLPADFNSKAGQNIMAEEFEDATVYNLMVEGVPQDKRQGLADDLAGFEDVTSVSYDPDDEAYNNGDFVLYTITSPCNSYSNKAKEIPHILESALEARGYTSHWIDASPLDNVSHLSTILVVAVAIAMVILFILASSWLEPLLLLITIVVAVLLNMGSNVFLGSVSDTTNSIAAILQMALSMDYLIMLLNRYRREAAVCEDREVAMERALTGGVTAIASSSVTTIVGLLCLVLMSFTIGRDMGVVLAKGVLLSLICAFGMMPMLVLSLEHAMEKTSKPAFAPKMKLFGAASYRMRHVMLFLFIAIILLCIPTKFLTVANFIIPSQNPDRAYIQEYFELPGQAVVIYNLDDEDRIAELTHELEQLDGVSSATSYATSLGKPYTVDEMAEQTNMAPGLLRILYYDCLGSDPTAGIPGDQLVSYVRSGLSADMGNMMDEDTASQLDSLADLMAGELGGGSYTLEQAKAALADHPSIRPSMLKLIYLAYFAHYNSDPAWTLSTDQLMTFINDEMLEDEAFADMMSAADRERMRHAAEQVEHGRDSMMGTEHGRIILAVTPENETPEMEQLVMQLRQMTDQHLDECYLVGQGPMSQEMSESFDQEFNFISLVTTLAIFLIVLITFRNIAVAIALVALIQCAFCIDVAANVFTGNHIYYIALLVVQSILMGATIDYAILYMTSYREARRHLAVREATTEAYRNSIRTIAMSGSILVLVCLALGMSAGGITGQICLIISEGAFAAVLLVLFILPGSTAALDKLFTKRKHRVENLPVPAETQDI